MVQENFQEFRNVVIVGPFLKRGIVAYRNATDKVISAAPYLSQGLILHSYTPGTIHHTTNSGTR